MIVSFYTENWQYPQKAEDLKQALNRFRIPYEIEFISGRGRWIDNTRLKATFILKMLYKYGKFLWVDVDSEILRNPFPEIFDHFTGDLLLRRHSTLPDRLYHVSVMGWSSNDKTKSLCKNWIERCDENCGTDEFNFDLAIKTLDDSLTVNILPKQYFVLPNQNEANPAIKMGLSKDPTKRAYTINCNGFKEKQ